MYSQVNYLEGSDSSLDECQLICNFLDRDEREVNEGGIEVK